MEKTHLGIQSCVLVQYYLKQYTYLKETAIVMKKFMAENNYNLAYFGTQIKNIF